MSSFTCRNNGDFSNLVQNEPGMVRVTISALKNSLMDPEVDIKQAYDRGVLYLEITPKEGSRRSETRGLIAA